MSGRGKGGKGLDTASSSSAATTAVGANGIACKCTISKCADCGAEIPIGYHFCFAHGDGRSTVGQGCITTCCQEHLCCPVSKSCRCPCESLDTSSSLKNESSVPDCGCYMAICHKCEAKIYILDEGMASCDAHGKMPEGVDNGCCGAYTCAEKECPCECTLLDVSDGEDSSDEVKSTTADCECVEGNCATCKAAIYVMDSADAKCGAHGEARRGARCSYLCGELTCASCKCQCKKERTSDPEKKAKRKQTTPVKDAKKKPYVCVDPEDTESDTEAAAAKRVAKASSSSSSSPSSAPTQKVASTPAKTRKRKPAAAAAPPAAKMNAQELQDLKNRVAQRKLEMSTKVIALAQAGQKKLEQMRAAKAKLYPKTAAAAAAAAPPPPPAGGTVTTTTVISKTTTTSTVPAPVPTVAAAVAAAVVAPVVRVYSPDDHRFISYVRSIQQIIRHPRLNENQMRLEIRAELGRQAQRYVRRQKEKKALAGLTPGVDYVPPSDTEFEEDACFCEEVARCDNCGLNGLYIVTEGMKCKRHTGARDEATHCLLCHGSFCVDCTCTCSNALYDSETEEEEDASSSSSSSSQKPAKRAKVCEA